MNTAVERRQPYSQTTRSRTSTSPGGAARELDIAESEMPALMALREQYREAAAAGGRQNSRLHPHDDPDRRAHRDAGGAGCRSTLVVVQHLLHTGPRGGGGRCRRVSPYLPGKGETEEEYEWCIEQTILKDGKPWDANMILDDGGDLDRHAARTVPEMLESHPRHYRRNHHRRASPL